MRIAATVLGIVAMVFLASFAFVLGIMAFTPTMPCTGANANTGTCAYGQLPQKIMLIGPWVVVVGATLATFVKPPDDGPRAYMPWLGVLAIAFVYLAAIAAAGG
ncbi:hypothetical protein FKR81_36945 [Lentzea tibetensis]|uniref:Uncharacterized protein n=1 Tax=Lentzea tibetensis TaxID=2591470 RepID=A0A563EHY5_9PSEU|nr:hypothetical protein [Lentzea tibetensis]TWP46123.1 hypothetical protein FKR81_36945 [Lentzea tibetensis]